MMNIVLLEPEMPANTGNIGRTCVATGTRLHLIEPLGFKLSEKGHQAGGPGLLGQAGRDRSTPITRTSWTAIPRQRAICILPPPRRTSSTPSAAYRPDCYLMFGKESAGIPEEILVANEPYCVRIPMWGEIRSLNLSNSVSIVLYEALRQNRFGELNPAGQLHRLHWNGET